MPGARLHRQLGPREQAGVLGGALRREPDVVLAGEQQDRRLKVTEGGPDSLRVDGPGRVVDGRCVVVALPRLPGDPGPAVGVPPAVGERCDRLPVGGGGLARPDAFEGGEGRREPGLSPSELGQLPAIQVADLHVDRPRTGRDQRETTDAVGVPGGVQQGERRTGRVPHQVEPVQPEVHPQRLDILDLPVAPVTRRVRRDVGLPGAAQIQQHQRATRGQPAQVTEVGRRLHRPARQADQRIPRVAVGRRRRRRAARAVLQTRCWHRSPARCAGERPDRDDAGRVDPAGGPGLASGPRRDRAIGRDRGRLCRLTVVHAGTVHPAGGRALAWFLHLVSNIRDEPDARLLGGAAELVPPSRKRPSTSSCPWPLTRT